MKKYHLLPPSQKGSRSRCKVLQQRVLQALKRPVRPDVKVPKPRQSGKRAKKGNKTRLKKAKKERKTSLKTNNDNKTKLKHKAARTKTAKKVKKNQKMQKKKRRK